MWAAAAGLLLSIVKWLFGGRQATEGELQGSLEQQNSDLKTELTDVQRANDAARSVDPDGMRSDPNNRDNASANR